MSLSGTGKINYFNNSPDTLSSLVIRLYNNLYKKGASRDFNINPDDVTQGVIISSLKLNGLPVDLSQKTPYQKTTTNIILNLSNIISGSDVRLAPGGKIEIEIEWNFSLPKISTVRFGAYSKHSAFIAYWYPQVAVYDDIDGMGPYQLRWNG